MKKLEYTEICEQISKAPKTFLPAILIHTIEEAVVKKVFGPGNLRSFLNLVVDKLEDDNG